MTPAIWTAMYAEVPLHDALRALHECGWHALEISTEHLVSIELSHDPNGLIAGARQCLQDLDLTAPQAHAHLHADVASPDALDRERDIKRLLRHIEISAALGVEQVVIHPGGCCSAPGRRQNAVQKHNMEAFRRLGDFAGEHDIRVGIENMPCPGFATAAELLELLQLIDHPAIGITLDTSHANMCSLDVAEMVCELGKHLVATHISDNDGSGDQHLIPGGGTIDWPEAMKALHGISYKGLFNLEIPGERHSVPGLRRLKTRFAFEVAEWLIGLAGPDNRGVRNT